MGRQARGKSSWVALLGLVSLTRKGDDTGRDNAQLEMGGVQVAQGEASTRALAVEGKLGLRHRGVMTMPSFVMVP